MKSASGFTIIELLIVVALIGIITTVGMGYYGDSVIRANRTEARSALSQAAGTLEKCRSLYGTYTDAGCSYANFNSETGLYAITAVRAGSSFTLTATPIAGAAQASDTDCTAFSLTNTGLKTATGADTTECW